MQRLFRFLIAGLAAGAVAWVPPRAVAGSSGTFVYVHDNETPDNRVFGFRFESNGALTPVPGSPFSTGDDWSNCEGLCQTAAFSGRGDLLFAGGATGITVFQVDDDDGSLSVVPGSPFGGERTIGVAAIDGLIRTFVYGAEFENDRIAGYQVQSNDTVSLLPPASFPTVDGPAGLDAAKGFLFAALFNDGAIAAFKARNDGALVPGPGSPVDLPAMIYNVEVDPAGKFVYAADPASSDIFAFKVKPNAGLRTVVGDAFSDALDNSESLAVSSKPLVFALDFGSGEVQAFRRNQNGSLTALGGVQDSGLADLKGVGEFDPKGKFLVLTDDDNNQVRSFSVNKNSGAITLVDTENADLGNTNAVVFAQP
jgi:6-phosphogluconolactonase (cycloisomerase 2 family)